MRVTIDYTGQGVGGRLSVSDVEAIMVDLLTVQQMHTMEFQTIKAKLDQTDGGVAVLEQRMDTLERKLDDVLISIHQLIHWATPPRPR